MEFVAEEESRQLVQEEVRDYHLNLFAECAEAICDGERSMKRVKI